MEQDDKKQASNIFSFEFWKQREMDLYVGKLLRYGVFTACFITVLGGIIYVMQSQGMPDYKPMPGHHDQFKGVVAYLRELNTIIPALLQLDGAAIIQFGVVVLIATPILRVAFSAIVFLIERDYLYVVVTLIVLAVILLNMVFGLH
ncbi:MAG: hypothetical protein BGN96_04015 [Bacteroidales bacterium 45-6]|nr:MAG: hypothetical protein BGN96_04015 [Bacteroidales bacterium 45-6]